MEKRDKRQNGRIECSGEYLYSTHTAGNRVECSLKNISVTGACISTGALLDNQEKVILHICRGKDMSFSGKVVWRNKDTYGISFDMDSEEEFSDISFIMNNFSDRI